MQTQLDSTSQRKPANRTPVLQNAVYFAPDGDLVTREFDLANHDGRVAIARLLTWAAHQGIEVRFRPSL